MRSRHVAEVAEPLSGSSSGGYRICPPMSAKRWLHCGVITASTFCFYAAFGLPNFCTVILAGTARLGPVQFLLTFLPEVHSHSDFTNRSYRVNQSLWLVSICCSIYTLIPEDKLEAGLVGWKMNLVTMETSMACMHRTRLQHSYLLRHTTPLHSSQPFTRHASDHPLLDPPACAAGIAATYGYSVAGGVPGGLLAEFVMSSLGKATVAEISPFVGVRLAKALTSFCLFMVMGSFMECAAIAAYAFAHRAGYGSDGYSVEGVNAIGERSNGSPQTALRSPGTSAAEIAQLPDFSDSLPADYRKGYGEWRSGMAKGARGEPNQISSYLSTASPSLVPNGAPTRGFPTQALPPLPPAAHARHASVPNTWSSGHVAVPGRLEPENVLLRRLTAGSHRRDSDEGPASPMVKHHRQ